MEIVQLFTSKDPSICRITLIDSQGLTPLHMAARNNHSDVVEYLLEQVNEKIQCSLCRERPKTMMLYKSQAEHVTYVIVLKNFHPYLFVTTALDAVRTDTP